MSGFHVSVRSGFVFLLSLFAACSPVINVTTPTQGVNAEPVSIIRANFTADFKPTEPWGIYLDGVKVTGFSPTPAPGVTSTAPIFLNKTPTGGAYFAGYQITTDATCGTFCVYPSQTVDFVPPQLRYNATNGAATATGDIAQFSVASVYVGVQHVRSVPIVVKVEEVLSPPFTSTLPIVSIGATGGSLQPPGTPALVTIPANDTRGQFFIKSATQGNYILRFTALGASPSQSSGKVMP